MKNLTLALSILTCSISFAEIPKISCGGMASKANSDFVGHISERVTTERKTITIGDSFSITTQLEQICAADGGPCSDSYKLYTTLKIDNSVSSTSSDISPETDRNFRQHLNLQVGMKDIYVNCDFVEDEE